MKEYKFDVILYKAGKPVDEINRTSESPIFVHIPPDKPIDGFWVHVRESEV